MPRASLRPDHAVSNGPDPTRLPEQSCSGGAPARQGRGARACGRRVRGHLSVPGRTVRQGDPLAAAGRAPVAGSGAHDRGRSVARRDRHGQCPARAMGGSVAPERPSGSMPARLRSATLTSLPEPTASSPIPGSRHLPPGPCLVASKASSFSDREPTGRGGSGRARAVRLDPAGAARNGRKGSPGGRRRRLSSGDPAGAGVAWIGLGRRFAADDRGSVAARGCCDCGPPIANHVVDCADCATTGSRPDNLRASPGCGRPHSGEWDRNGVAGSTERTLT
jgi:hypothetical protein